MTGLRFDLRDPPPGAAALRAEVAELRARLERLIERAEEE